MLNLTYSDVICPDSVIEAKFLDIKVKYKDASSLSDWINYELEKFLNNGNGNVFFWQIYKISNETFGSSLEEIIRNSNLVANRFNAHQIETPQFYSNIVLILDREFDKELLKKLIELNKNEKIISKVFLYDYFNIRGNTIGADEKFYLTDIFLTIRTIANSFAAWQSNFKEFFNATFDNPYKSLFSSFHTEVVNYSLLNISKEIANDLGASIIEQLIGEDSSTQEMEISLENFEEYAQNVKFEISSNYEYSVKSILTFSSNEEQKSFAERILKQLENFPLTNIRMASPTSELLKKKKSLLRKFAEKIKDDLIDENSSLLSNLSFYSKVKATLKERIETVDNKLQQIQYNFRNYIRDKRQIISEHLLQMHQLRKQYPSRTRYNFHFALFIISTGLIAWMLFIKFDSILLTGIVAFIGILISWLYYYLNYNKVVKILDIKINDRILEMDRIVNGYDINNLKEFMQENLRKDVYSELLVIIERNLSNLLFIKKYLEGANTYTLHKSEYFIELLENNLVRSESMKESKDEYANKYNIYEYRYCPSSRIPIVSSDKYEQKLKRYVDYLQIKLFNFEDNVLNISSSVDVFSSFQEELLNEIFLDVLDYFKDNLQDDLDEGTKIKIENEFLGEMKNLNKLSVSIESINETEAYNILLVGKILSEKMGLGYLQSANRGLYNSLKFNKITTEDEFMRDKVLFLQIYPYLDPFS